MIFYFICLSMFSDSFMNSYMHSCFFPFVFFIYEFIHHYSFLFLTYSFVCQLISPFLRGTSLPLFYLTIYAYIHSLVDLFVYSFKQSFLHSFTRSLICSFIRSSTRSSISLFVYLSNHSFIYVLNNKSIDLSLPLQSISFFSN